MRRKTYVLWKKRLIKFTVLTLVLGALCVYFRTGVFTLTTYEITGAPEAYLPQLQHDVRLLAEEKLYWVLPGNRSISYHDNDIRTLLRETLPNTSTISIRPTGLHTLTIKLTSYTPLYSVSDTHAIAYDGTVYKEISPIKDLPRLSIASTTKVTPEELAAIDSLTQNVNAVLFPVKYIDIDQYNDLRLYDETKSTSVITPISLNISKVWSNILSAIDTDPLKKKLQAHIEHLEYIDARFGNKVFYKFTNASAPAIIPPHDDISASSTLH